METTVLGVRLNKLQRDKLRVIATENKMSEVEVARLLIDSAVRGKIRVEKGQVVIAAQ